MTRGFLRACAVVLMLLPVTSFADGARLLLSPSTGTYTVGSTFDVRILASTGTTSVNAIEAALSFNPRTVIVDHVSIGGSVLSSWPTPPEFSNTNGTIEFAGWANNRYLGSEGTLVTVTFKAVSVGETPLTFESGAMLAPEGQETNIVSTLRSGAYTIQPKSEADSAPTGAPVPVAATTSEPVPEPATPASDDERRSAQAAAAAASGSTWWSVALFLMGCGIGMCIGYALRAQR